MTTKVANARAELTPTFQPPERTVAPCRKCKLPLLKGEAKCPRCRGAHFKDLTAP